MIVLGLIDGEMTQIEREILRLKLRIVKILILLDFLGLSHVYFQKSDKSSYLLHN